MRRCLLIERLTDRCVLAAITGEIFSDLNETLRREADEQGLANRVVFADLNQNRLLDGEEPVAISDLNGQFRFEGVDPGEYSLELFLGGETQFQTFPATADLRVLSVGGSQAESILSLGQHWYSLSGGEPDGTPGARKPWLRLATSYRAKQHRLLLAGRRIVSISYPTGSYSCSELAMGAPLLGW